MTINYRFRLLKFLLLIYNFSLISSFSMNIISLFPYISMQIHLHVNKQLHPSPHMLWEIINDCNTCVYCLPDKLLWLVG